MFDVGFWEIFLILILALVVIGPERLPRAARTAGMWFGRARRYIEGVKSEVEQEFDVAEFKRLMHNQEIQLNELRSKLKEKIDSESGDIQSEIKLEHDIEEESHDQQENKKKS